MHHLFETVNPPRQLAPGSVRVYVLGPERFDDEATKQFLLACLSPEERARHQRFRFDRDRLNYLIAHGMLRQLLSVGLDIEPAGLEFVSGTHGKPRLAKGSSDLHFNLSHTDGLCALVISRGCECGIDVENHQRNIGFEAIAGRMFAAEELDYIRAGDSVDVARFYAIWTLREAWLKAKGTGIAGNNRACYFECDGGDGAILFDRQRAAAWQFCIAQPTSQHSLAVCVASTTDVRFEFDTALL